MKRAELRRRAEATARAVAGRTVRVAHCTCPFSFSQWLAAMGRALDAGAGDPQGQREGQRCPVCQLLPPITIEYFTLPPPDHGAPDAATPQPNELLPDDGAPLDGDGAASDREE